MITAAPASTGGQLLGSLGAGGLALALTVLLILGIKGKGKRKLSSTAAMVIAFVAGTMYAGAGGIWAWPAQLISQGLLGVGVGRGDGPFGEVGMGAIATIIAVVIWFAGLRPARSAIVGIIAATVWAAAGGIWIVPSEVVATVATSWGV